MTIALLFSALTSFSTPALPPAAVSVLDEDPPVPAWTGSFTAGISATDGNTDVKKASATADAKKELEGSRYTFGLSWNFSQESGLITQRKTFANAKYDRFIDEKNYWLAQTSAEADEQAGIDLRTTLGFGAGRQLLDGEHWKAGAELGLTWFNQEDAGSTSEDYMAARVAYNWGWTPSDSWEVGQTAEMYPSVEDSSDVSSKLDTRVKATLGSNMFAQLQWVMDWDNTPTAGAKRVDNLYLLTIGWSF